MKTHTSTSQFIRVPSGRDTDSRRKQMLWSLLSPAQRAIICTDGTLTLLLSAFSGEDIVTEGISTHIEYLNNVPSSSEIVLTRHVKLVTKGTRQPLVYATSEINLERMPISIIDQLLRTGDPIGLILRSHKLETFREIIDWGYSEAPKFAAACKGEMLVYRTYAIISGKRIIVTISEYFDNNLMDCAGASYQHEKIFKLQ